MFQGIAQIIEYLGLTGQHIGAFLLGGLVSLVVTQVIKKMFYLSGRPVFFIGLLFGFVIAYGICPPAGFVTFDWVSVAVGLLAGLAATETYKLGMAILDWKLPELAEKIRGQE